MTGMTVIMKLLLFEYLFLIDPVDENIESCQSLLGQCHISNGGDRKRTDYCFYTWKRAEVHICFHRRLYFPIPYKVLDFVLVFPIIAFLLFSPFFSFFLFYYYDPAVRAGEWGILKICGYPIS